ncbi:extracellular solute-binding protein [Arachidicoccus sp.]|jgi:multiple sugar transport system substrate-binding protein|uniref:extracellular solute-binding protein n=1 Tax=Arachidicoccus sp. TaxID=1872624 RepID=UPI003D24D471
MSPSNKILRIAVRRFAPFEYALEKIWHSFAMQTGCNLDLEFCSMDLPELHQTLFEENGLTNGKWDIVQISSDWILEGINAKTIENLSPFILAKEEKNYLENWPTSLLRSQTFESNIYGIPFHDGPECLIYRKDLFESEENKATFRERFGKELTLPQNWESYFQIANFFSDLESNLYGTALAAFPDGHNVVYDFCIQIWSRGGDFIKADNSININIPQTIEGLTYYRNLIQSKNIIHPESKNFDSVKLGQAFAKGEVAMTINWFGFAAYAQLEGAPNIKNNIGVYQIPTDGKTKSISPNSYWMYSIAKGCQNKSIAYDFISFATNLFNDCLLTLEGGIGCRYSTYENKEINQKISFFYQLEKLHGNAVELPNIPTWPRVAHQIDNLMQQVINTHIPIEKLVEEAQSLIVKNI